jgi:hypothetical protein
MSTTGPDITSKNTAELDAELSELQFDIFFLKCQLIFDSTSTVDLNKLSDENDRISEMEIKSSQIEAELKRRGNTICERKSIDDSTSSQNLQVWFHDITSRSNLP